MSNKQIKIMHIVGARPNFVKAAPVIAAISKQTNFQQLLVHTGQHYSTRLSDSFFKQLNIPHPDINLGIGSSPTHGQQTAKLLKSIENYLIQKNPDLVMVYGDVNSTLAAALAASKLNIKLAHVESGLRSGDRTMPEEINRIVTDSLSNIKFVTESSGLINLLKEGSDPKSVHLVGNTMIDSLCTVASPRKDKLALGPILLTCHRPSNVDTKEGIKKILKMCGEIANEIIFPVHPRTRQKIKDFKLTKAFESMHHLQMVEPMDYLSFIQQMQKSIAVITDSGGIQEETTYLGIPCLTIRKNTERPVTITAGTNILTPELSDIKTALHNIKSDVYKLGKIPPGWNGKASEKIAKILLDYFN